MGIGEAQSVNNTFGPNETKRVKAVQEGKVLRFNI